MFGVDGCDEIMRNVFFFGQVALHRYLVVTVDRTWILLYSSSTGFVQGTGYRITGYSIYRVEYRIQDTRYNYPWDTGYRT